MTNTAKRTYNKYIDLTNDSFFAEDLPTYIADLYNTIKHLQPDDKDWLMVHFERAATIDYKVALEEMNYNFESLIEHIFLNGETNSIRHKMHCDMILLSLLKKTAPEYLTDDSHNIINAVSALSTKDYNSPRTLLQTICEAVLSDKNIPAPQIRNNPFKL